jgi:hypothetical protein
MTAIVLKEESLTALLGKVVVISGARPPPLSQTIFNS